MLMTLAALSQGDAATEPVTLTQEQFLVLFDSNRLVRATILYDPKLPFLREIAGAYFQNDAAGNGVLEKGVLLEVPFKAKVRITEPLERRLLEGGVVMERAPNQSGIALLYRLLPFLVIGIVIGAVLVLIWVFGLGQNDH